MAFPPWTLREVPAELQARYRAEGLWADETLGQHVDDRLSANPDVAFVVHSASNPWRGNFAGLLDLSARVATGLIDLGVEPGDVVSFQTPNWVEGAATFYAAAMVGAVVAPIVHIYGVHEVSYILGQCKPRVHVTAARFAHQDYLANLRLVGDLAATTVVVGGRVGDGDRRFDDLAASSPLERPVPVDPSMPALVGWTSGTTSSPKGVVHSHRSVLAELSQGAGRMPPDFRPILMSNPIGHAIGMLGALLGPLDVGKPVHLLDQFDPQVALELMMAEDLTVAGGVPYFLTTLLDHPDCTPEHVRRLGYQGMGGAPIPLAVAERATNLGILVWRSYGSSEHPSISGSLYSDPLDKRIGTDGCAMPGNELRLIDEEGDDVATGQPGEVISRGPELFVGYTDAELTARVFDDEGWYHTGDIAIADEDGYIRITDRRSDVIIRGGENISAAEVEELLLRLPGVAEAAVVASPDPRMGERAVAVLRAGPLGALPSLREMSEHLERAGLARQKWPEEIVEVTELPRTASGKVQKFRLREQVRDRGTAQSDRRDNNEV